MTPAFLTLASVTSSRCLPLLTQTLLTDSKVPFDAEDRRGIVYVWIGSKADPEEATVAEEIAYSLYDTESFSLQVRIDLHEEICRHDP